jgi:arylsulfatase A-like enzyme
MTQITELEKPNILFIFADDLGKEWISSYGAEEIETPKIDKLARNGLMFENFYAMPQCTPIIFTTDNGSTTSITGPLNGREVKGGKQKTTENGICVPFIVNCPGMVPKGKVTDALSDITDVFPTFIELANTEVPDSIITDGVSQAKLFTGISGHSQRDWIMAMGGGNRAALSEKGVENEYRFRDRVIRDKKYKLFVSSERKPEKLVNLKTDPEEKNNLLPPSNPETKFAFEKLWKVIEDFPEKDNDPIYNPLPPQPWNVNITVESEVWKK